MGRIEEIKERRSKVTNEGNWFVMHGEDLMGSRGYDEPDSLGWVKGGMDDVGQNAEFVANAPQDIQYLLSRLEIAEGALEQIHELDDGDPNVSLGRIAREALQQIRS